MWQDQVAAVLKKQQAMRPPDKDSRTVNYKNKIINRSQKVVARMMNQHELINNNCRTTTKRIGKKAILEANNKAKKNS